MKVAIVGAGIAGTTLAYWLHRYGHEPTLIEKAPRLRTGGYLIDFWGGGYAVAELMGLGPALQEAGYAIEKVRLVDRHGRRVGGFSADVFRRNVNSGYVSVPRGALVELIYQTVAGKIETVFGDSVSGIAAHDSGVDLTLCSGRSQSFDLVVGTGGIHSPVRELVFGPEADFERDLGYRVAAFDAVGYRPRDGLAYLAYTTPGCMVARFAMRDDRTTFLFVFTKAHMSGPDPEDLAGAKSCLRQVFGSGEWELPQILRALDGAPEVYFDRVSQIVMDSWSNGRVALIGDAAAAVSLLAGEGAGLAMVEAYQLANALNADSDHHTAFRNYEQAVRPIVEERQRSARAFAAMFAPKTAIGLWTRNQATKLLNIRPLADRMVRSEFRNDIPLPQPAPSAR